VNEAYRALKDPVARAQYLLSLHGVDAFDETNTALPFAFLERQLERREIAEIAVADGDARALETVLADVRAESGELEQRVSSLLDVEGAWEAARVAVRELRFLAKLAADVDVMLAARDD
jgi:molecular chaperone HscB